MEKLCVGRAKMKEKTKTKPKSGSHPDWNQTLVCIKYSLEWRPKWANSLPFSPPPSPNTYSSVDRITACRPLLSKHKRTGTFNLIENSYYRFVTMNEVFQWLSNHLFPFLFFKLHFPGCLKLCFLMFSLTDLLPSCDCWCPSRPCTSPPPLSCQEKNMAQEPQGTHDVSAMLSCLLAASDHLLCDVSFILFGVHLLFKCG